MLGLHNLQFISQIKLATNQNQRQRQQPLQSIIHPNLLQMFYILLLFFNVINSATLVDLLGLTYLYEGMGVVSQTTLSNGTKTTTYQVSPQNYAFLSNFQTLTDFCDYKCQKFYNLPCFLVFGCNIQLRNICAAVLIPIIVLAITAWFCSKGWWTGKCWCHYLMLFSGLRFLFWVYNKITRAKQIEEARQRQRQGSGEEKKQQEGTQKQLQLEGGYNNNDYDDEI